MSEIEQAIKNRIIYHCDETKYRYELGKGVIDICVKDIVSDIQSLKEKQERDKGCDFCKPPFKSILTVELGEFGNGDTAYLYIETDGQNLRAYDNDPRSCTIEAKQIQYCPMCGRKLKEEDKQ